MPDQGDAKLVLPGSARDDLLEAADAYKEYCTASEDFFGVDSASDFLQQFVESVGSGVYECLAAGVDADDLEQLLVRKFPQLDSVVQQVIAGVDLEYDDSEDAPESASESDEFGVQTHSGSIVTLDPRWAEMIRRYAPAVADCIYQPTPMPAWLSERLARIDPDGTTLHALTCYHGEHEKGWLVLTMDQMWWMQRGALSNTEESLFYTAAVDVNKMNATVGTLVGVIGVVSGQGGSVGQVGRTAAVSIGGDLFQMTNEEADLVASLIRQMQRLPDSVESSARSAVGAEPVPPTPHPMDMLKELAALHASGVLTDEEFAAKKTDLLERQW